VIMVCDLCCSMQGASAHLSADAVPRRRPRQRQRYYAVARDLASRLRCRPRGRRADAAPAMRDAQQAWGQAPHTTGVVQ
jgi:hypothetical protein